MRYEVAGSGLTRREFLALTTASSAAVVTGCAMNPVTGDRQFMLMSESQELAVDRQRAPHQFSADYGVSTDVELNAYIREVGDRVAAVSHRPAMPYNFRCVNNVHVNAYTFPAGSMAVTRGLLLEMETEADLAAVLGHECGHVSARHTAARMSKGVLTMAVLAGITAYVDSEKEEWSGLVAGLGAIGANALLSRYSRDDERQADALGMAYMTEAGYPPAGMVRVLRRLQALEEDRPAIVNVLFATHPLSKERVQTAIEKADSAYASYADLGDGRVRFKDETAALRRVRDAIESMQAGHREMGGGNLEAAEAHFRQALRGAPGDYAALLMLASCLHAGDKTREALSVCEDARGVYPEEPMALHVGGMIHIKLGHYEDALLAFTEYEEELPGNSNTIFFRGYCLDRLVRREEAAQEYVRYLQAAPSGEHAEWVRARLQEWGVNA